jgi:hypothetical protein
MFAGLGPVLSNISLEGEIVRRYLFIVFYGNDLPFHEKLGTIFAVVNGFSVEKSAFEQCLTQPV